MSTQSSVAVEEVAKARGGPIWYQLYTTNNFDITTQLVKRAEAAGCTAVAVTVDTPAGRNTETATRLARTDTRQCAACHDDATGNRMNPRAGAGTNTKPMFAGLNSFSDRDSARFARTPSATTLPTLESARLTLKSETRTTSR